MTSLVSPVPSIVPLLSKDYSGEWVNLTTGDATNRIFVEPKELFFRNGGNAIVLGNGTSRTGYTLSQFNKNNKYKRLDYYNILYGCNSVHTEGDVDFLVMTNKILASRLPKSLRTKTFAPADFLKLGTQLIPQQLTMDAGSLAVYLACFHGASRIFLYGFDGQDTPGMNNNRFAGTLGYDAIDVGIDDTQWNDNLFDIIAAYANVDFYRVDHFPQSSRRLFQLSNYHVIPFAQFISMADL